MSMYGITKIKRFLSMIQLRDRANAYKLFFVAYMLKYVEIIPRANYTRYGKEFFLEHITYLYGKSIQSKDLAAYLSDLFTNVGIVSADLEREFQILLDGTATNIISEIFSTVNESKINGLSCLQDMVKALLENDEYIYNGPQSYFDFFDLTDSIKSKILQCDEHMTLYDGFCRLGVSINAVADGKASLYMQDIEQSSVPVALIITTILGNKIGKVSTENTFSQPIAADCYFDRIILDPPLGMKIEKARIQPELAGEISVNTSDIGVFALQHAWHHLKNDGIAIVRVSAGILSKGGHTQDIRKHFVDLKCIDAVIWLPAYERARNSMNTALLIIRKNNSNDSIYMVDSGAYVRGIKVEDHREIIKAGFPEMYKNCTEKKGISRSVKISEICENEYNLSPLRYVSKQEPSQTAASMEEIQELQQKYNALVKEMEECDSKLNEIRKELSGGKI